MVIDRGAFLSGRYAKVFDEIVQVKEACGDAHLKVILEIGELGTYDNVRRASLLAMAAGARLHQDVDRQAARRRDAAGARSCMLEAIRDVHEETGPQGRHEAGRRHPHREEGDPVPRAACTRRSAPDWLTPDLYRLGASSLAQRHPDAAPQGEDGRYQARTTSPMTELERNAATARRSRRTGRTRPRPSRATSSAAASATASSSAASGSSRQRDASRRSRRATRSRSPRSAQATEADVERAVAAAREAFANGWSRRCPARAREVPVPDRAHPRRSARASSPCSSR